MSVGDQNYPISLQVVLLPTATTVHIPLVDDLALSHARFHLTSLASILDFFFAGSVQLFLQFCPHTLDFSYSDFLSALTMWEALCLTEMSPCEPQPVWWVQKQHHLLHGALDAHNAAAPSAPQHLHLTWNQSSFSPAQHLSSAGCLWDWSDTGAKDHDCHTWPVSCDCRPRDRLIYIFIHPVIDIHVYKKHLLWQCPDLD